MGRINLSTPYTILDAYGFGEPNPSSTPVETTSLWETPAVTPLSTPATPYPTAYPLLHHPTPFAAFRDPSFLKRAPADIAPNDDGRYSVDAVVGDLHGLSLTPEQLLPYDYRYGAQDETEYGLLIRQSEFPYNLDGIPPRRDLNQKAVDGWFLVDRKIEAAHIGLGPVNPQASYPPF